MHNIIIDLVKVVDVVCINNMKNSKKLTVIIPTKNEEEYLPVLLSCLESQTEQGFDILVADNQSSDRTIEVCKKYNTKVIVGGLPGKGRNEGVKFSKTELCLFLDADIMMGPDFIERALIRFKVEKADIMSFAYKPIEKSLTMRMIHSLSLIYFRAAGLTGRVHGLGGATLVKKRVHKELGGFDETITVAEDQDYLNRGAKRYKYKLTGEPIVKLSTRRFILEGTLMLCLKWMRVEIHRIVFGEIRSGKPRYFESGG